MTARDVIYILENYYEKGEYGEVHISKANADDMVKVSLKELKKQVPREPNYEGDGCDKDGNIIYDMWLCPQCDKEYELEYEEYKYCPNCGQAIDWSSIKEANADEKT